MKAETPLTRRDWLRGSAVGVGAVALMGLEWIVSGLVRSTGHDDHGLQISEALADNTYIEVFPTSPLILAPFTEPLPIPKALAPVPPPGANVTLSADGTAILPDSTIYGYNGQFPGPMINAEYGRPVLVRFENHLDENPGNLDRQDYGNPNLGFITHLHNGHTAAESDGNPNHRHQGYLPGQWVDNLYLNYPAGGDEREKQSFFWFHDHFHNHTGADVYKGLAGLYPIYDPSSSLDMGDETRGLRLPGVRTNNPDGSFDVAYDIPLALYDACVDDGVTQHKDFHNGNGETHPEWWGKTFFRHFPNHGFVGDIFTINGKAHSVLEVKR